MDLAGLITRTRSYVRDTSGNIFTSQDIINYINEGIDRVKIIPQLNTMKNLINQSDAVSILPVQFHYLLSVYSASRCMFQDEQDYRAGTLMNEFENKLSELETKINKGEIIIKDANGNEITSTNSTDYIVDEYFAKPSDDEFILDY